MTFKIISLTVLLGVLSACSSYDFDDCEKVYIPDPDNSDVFMPTCMGDAGT